MSIKGVVKQSAPIATEELAELHAIIQALEYEREFTGIQLGREPREQVRPM